MENTVGTDAGAAIRDGMKTINQDGVCPEIEWPYDINYFTECPSKYCYDLAYRYRSIEYKRIQQELNQLKKCIDDNYLIICGISIFDSFESSDVAQTGKIPIPSSSESFLGGHAVLLAGYDDNNEQFILRNSWGVKWGEQGYGYIPYDYILNEKLASDFWIIEKIVEPVPTSDHTDSDSVSEADSESDSESTSNKLDKTAEKDEKDKNNDKDVNDDNDKYVNDNDEKDTNNDNDIDKDDKDDKYDNDKYDNDKDDHDKYDKDDNDKDDISNADTSCDSDETKERSK